MDVLVDDFWKGQIINNQPQKVPSFFIRSTAPINIEDDEQLTDETLPTMGDVIEALYQNSQANTSYTGLVIQIHGYNTGVQSAVLDDGKPGGQNYDYVNVQKGKRVGIVDYIYKDWKNVSYFLNQSDPAIFEKSNSFVYLGYRWPSESVPSDLYTAATALPIILKLLFRSGLILGLIGLVLLILLPSAIADALNAILTIAGVALAAIVGSLFILRIIVYFRDSYRATNFGVPDLVEFIRQLDLGLVKRKINDPLFEAVKQTAGQGIEIAPAILDKAVRKTWEVIENQSDLLANRQDDTFGALLPQLKQGTLAQLDDAIFFKIYASFVAAPKPSYTTQEFDEAASYWNQEKTRIRLTFIGHSMGGFVTTQVIRILSDAFDPKAIGDRTSLEKLPASVIGRVFCLGRLVLVSPDIQLKTIISGRTNFLRSSLRRFEEAYLFSNEGDLALRLASTAANYFSFPASTRSQGFRLGNVSVNLPDQNVYGIVNLEQLASGKVDHLLQYIGVQTLEREDRSLRVAAHRKQEGQEDNESLATAKPDPESIADLFTYFDCTEYRDLTTYYKRDNQEMNVLICNGQRSPLKFWSYVKLLKAYVDFSKNPAVGVDVHGGYFYGHFSKLLIYRLAFLGFQGLLDSIITQSPEEFDLKAPSNEFQDRLNQARQLPLQDRRQAALKYLSWICEQKRIQVAASPERYYVDILGSKRSKVRAGMLTRAATGTAQPSSD